jgi:uncharacterized protein (TIGR00730 family)
MRACVFCGGSVGRRPEYAAAARLLGAELSLHGIDLVYGGSHLGLMGVLADSVLSAGGHVIGVIPSELVHKEVAHKHLPELRVADGLADRKHQMAQLADMFIALPGGAGTLNELSEMWTLAKLGMHSKPCGLLNTARFYDPLLVFIRLATAEGFISPEHGDLLVTAEHPSEMIRRLMAVIPS